jgi:hypothetical protein
MKEYYTPDEQDEMRKYFDKLAKEQANYISRNPYGPLGQTNINAETDKSFLSKKTYYDDMKEAMMRVRAIEKDVSFLKNSVLAIAALLLMFVLGGLL